MRPPLHDDSARFVLDRFPLPDGSLSLTPLGNRGGFSGALLWRCDGRQASYCLRAWPTGTVPQQLSALHALMRRSRDRGLPFVPALFAARCGATRVEQEGRLWEVTSWLPGQADFHARPTAGKLRAACSALARLHLGWNRPTLARSRCPAVQRRLLRLQQWQELLHSGWQPHFGACAALDAVAERAWRLLPACLDQLPTLLKPWRARPLPLQFCLCDVWHDHLLYEGDELTGLVDYGAVKTDHVAVDLARMLGSLVGDDREGWAAGLEAYRERGSLSADEEALAVVLDRSGTVLGATNWLRWVYRDGRPFEDLGLVAQRLAVLVERMACWEGGGRILVPSRPGRLRRQPREL